MPGKLFIISAPSGAGKTTLVNEVLGRLGPKYPIDRVITYTSRAVRSGEEPGKDYHFLSPEAFKRKVDEGFFLEWSGEYDHYYGTPHHTLNDLEQGLSRVLVIDRAGAQALLEIAQDPSPTLREGVVPIWIYTSDLVELKRRLLARGKNTNEQIERRLELAQKEVEKEREKPLYKHRILNDNFIKAAQELEALFVCELEK